MQAQNRGSGHLWPVLSAERGEHQVADGDAASAAELLLGMSRTGSGVGLIPEQVWENADLPASPFGTPPECASIGFVNGEAAGSASPLTWSAASFVRLSRTIRDGEITEQPVDTVARYIDNTQGATTLTLTSPANGSLVTGTATVSRHDSADRRRRHRRRQHRHRRCRDRVDDRRPAPTVRSASRYRCRQAPPR